MRPEKRVIPMKRSVIVAADFPDLQKLREITEQVDVVPGIGGIKIGFRLGLKNIVAAAGIIRKNRTHNIRIIYDHQKAGNDIPEMGKGFAEDLKSAGVDAVILFPFAGPKTQITWTEACFGAGLQVLTGGIMTHPEFLVSEGGYIADDAPERIFQLAGSLGVRHFVVPGTKLEWVRKLRGVLIHDLGESNFVLYAPGFITQGGEISECAKIAGQEWHAIVGSAIYKAENAYEAAMKVTAQI